MTWEPASSEASEGSRGLSIRQALSRGESFAFSADVTAFRRLRRTQGSSLQIDERAARFGRSAELIDRRQAGRSANGGRRLRATDHARVHCGAVRIGLRHDRLRLRYARAAVATRVPRLAG